MALRDESASSRVCGENIGAVRKTAANFFIFFNWQSGKTLIVENDFSRLSKQNRVFGETAMDKETFSLILFIVFVAVAFGVFVWNIAATVADRKRNIRWMRNFEDKWNSMTKFTEIEYLYLRELILEESIRVKENEEIEDSVKESSIKKMQQIKDKLEMMKE